MRARAGATTTNGHHPHDSNHHRHNNRQQSPPAQQQGAIIENELHNNGESNVEVRGEVPDDVDPLADADALHRKKVCQPT